MVLKNFLLIAAFTMIIAISSVGMGLMVKYDQQVENRRQWVDVGTIVSVSLVSGSNRYFGESCKTEIKTKEYTFIVVGVVNIYRTGTRVLWSGDYIRFEGTNQRYKLFEPD